MRVYLIGIGGIGISGLAQYYLTKGAEVFGSDLVSSEITQALEQKGAKLLIGKHKAGNLPKNADLVVYSPAIQENNPELKQALMFQASGFKLQVQSYPQALGELTKKYFTIAISGTHGKSTTTAMISLILVRAGLDPTVILGTKLKEFKDSNFRLGKSEFLVIEADEWDASFLNYWPKIIVLTNIEEEHLDYYKNLNNILGAYKKYVSHLPKDGVLVINSEDKNIEKVKRAFLNKGLKTAKYSLAQKEAGQIKKILKVPGRHNIFNALAALTVARVLKIPDKVSFKALSEYRGAWRRFEEKELKIENCKLKIISDYAHHPTEIKVTLAAAREKWPEKEIWVIFQPHQHQRTFYLFDKFVKVFAQALVDKIILVPIYDVAGREETEIKKKVDSLKLAESIRLEVSQSQGRKEVIYAVNMQRAVDFLERHLTGKEIVIVMGAGDIYKLPTMFST